MKTYETNLGELLDLYNGKAIKPGGDGIYPVFGANGIIGGSSESIYSEGIIIGRVGAYCGAVQYCLDEFWASDNTIVSKPKDDNDIVYLYYLLAHLNLNVYAGGAAQPLLTQTVIRQIKARVPYPQDQRRIADILSAYDNLIENNTRRIRILEMMAQAIYREWFGKVSPDSLPDGWEIKTLEEVTENFDSKRIPLSSIKRAEMQGEYPYYGAAKILDHVNDYIFDGKYLLMAEDGSVITTDGKPVLQMAYDKFWVNNHTHVLQGIEPVSTEYLYLCLSEVNITGYITGAAQPKITQANLNRIPIIIPPKDSLMESNRVFEEFFDMIEILNQKNDNLRQTRDLLLPRLVSGAVEVSEMNNNN